VQGNGIATSPHRGGGRVSAPPRRARGVSRAGWGSDAWLCRSGRLKDASG